jgi:hypothetical protein
MPRHGVGLNELLGGWDAGVVEALADLPKAEAGRPERAPRTFRRPSPKEQVRRRKNEQQTNIASEAGKRNAHVNL